MKTKLFRVLGIIALLAFGSASAAITTGHFNVSGICQLNSSTVNTAQTVLSWGTMSVDFTSETFTNLPPFTPVTGGTPMSLSSAGLTNSFLVGTAFTNRFYSSAIVGQSGGFLGVSGFGEVSGVGYQPSPTTWNLSVQDPSSSGNNFTMSMSFSTFPPATNDLCSSAIVISSVNYTNQQSTTNATSSGDPLPTCVTNFGRGVWYQYTPTSSGTLAVDTFGSGFNTGLAIYTGSCGALSELACNDDSGGSQSQISLPVTNGVTYFILAGGVNASVGSLVIHSVLTPSSVFISQSPVSVVQTNGGPVTFNVTATGPGPLTYQWLFNGANIGSFIATVAGNGTYSFSGDNGAATNAAMEYPAAVTVDSAGNLFVVDQNNQRIRKIGTNGIITTVAGSGSSGYSGDGGVATSASLYYPSGVAADGAGNIFIADNYNHRIRKVGTNSIITTVAGSGSTTFAGDGGAATNASLYYPNNMTVDGGGNIFIADTYHSRIRKVDTNGIITTVAGNGNNGFSGDGGAATNATINYPYAVALDGTGNLYIADYYNNRIRKVGTNGIITTVAGSGTYGYSGDGGAATSAAFRYPADAKVDNAGNLFIVDYSNYRIRKVDTGGVITTVAGTGTYSFSGDGNLAANATLENPSGVAVDGAGNLFIADFYNNRVRKVYAWPTSLSSLTFPNITTNNIGSYSVIVTNNTGSVTSSVATLNMPVYIAVQPASQTALLGKNITFSPVVGGSLPLNFQWAFNGTNLSNGTNASYTVTNAALTDAGNYVLTVTNLYGSVISSNAVLTVAYISQQPTNQIGAGGSAVNFAVAMSVAGPFTYQWQLNGVNLPSSGIITTVAGNGVLGYTGNGGVATSATLNNPHGSVVDGLGNLFIADYNNHRIRKVDANGIITTIAGTGVASYSGDGGAATSATLNFPAGIILDSSGNLLIADYGNQRVRKISTNGVITTIAGKGITGFSGDGNQATNASISNPSGLALDSFGNLFIADYSNNRIRKVNTNGIITTVAGSAVAGSSGDGDLATSATLRNPAGVAVDKLGNLFIADYNNYRIRKVDTNGIITTYTGKGTYGFSGDGGMATNAFIGYTTSVTADAAGNVFISDLNFFRVREIGTNGIITTVAGNGTGSHSGDGGPATSATLLNVRGVTVDNNGNLFIAENSYLRKVVGNPAYPPTLASLTLGNLSATNVGNYSVVIKNASGSITSSVVALTVQVPPVITLQPFSQTVGVGANPSFTVTAIGTGPFAYGLFFNGTNLVQSGTNNSLTLSSVSTNDAGSYTLVVTNAYGSVTSQVATLTVVLAPIIITQPMNLTNVAGTTATFSITAGGIGPFSYQWQFNGSNLPGNLITTVAGKTNSGSFSGDGGAATNAGLNPWSIAFDAAGNAYIADRSNHRVRKVNTNGIITTVAGNGVAAYSGDGGVATNAAMNNPIGVTLDAAGNLYIADRYNYRIRKVGTNGIITTVAGTSSSSYSGDGGAAITAGLGFSGSLVLFALGFDAVGNLFASDYNIRKIDTNGVISKVAGNSTTGFSGDGGLATSAALNAVGGTVADAVGNLYIADANNNRVRKVDASGIITTIAGNGIANHAGDGGAATNASLNNPWFLALDAAGNLFVSERNSQYVRKVDTKGIVSTVAGNGNLGYSGDGGTATNASLHPAGLGFDSAGNLYIADDNFNVVRDVHLPGDPTLVLTNVSTANVGNYSVIVGSPYGSVTSSVVMLNIPAYIITPPQNQNAAVGYAATFNVTAGGTPALNYQWWMNSTPQSNATATPVVYYGFMVTANMSNVGAGYLNVPQVQMLGGSGVGAGGYAVVSNRTVTAIIMTNAGFGYFTPPTIQIDPPTAILLSGQTGNSLTLSPVANDSAGNYFVTVSNNYGSVTSALVALTVFLPPQNFIGYGINGGTNGRLLNLQWSGTANYPYALQTATNLTPPIFWQSILTNPADTNGNWTFTVTNLSNAPQRFYRALGQ